MGWREWKVAVEYDGVQHWTDRRQRSWDIERIAMLEASGWVVVPVSADTLGGQTPSFAASATSYARQVPDMTLA